jgi:hypothetical protein
VATIAEQWLEKIDHPALATPSGISRDEIERMQEDAVDVLQSFGDDIYVFEDGSGLYEKRKDDWYPADEETIKDLQGEDEEDEKTQAAEY